MVHIPSWLLASYLLSPARCHSPFYSSLSFCQGVCLPWRLWGLCFHSAIHLTLAVALIIVSLIQAAASGDPVKTIFWKYSKYLEFDSWSWEYQEWLWLLSVAGCKFRSPPVCRQHFINVLSCGFFIYRVSLWILCLEQSAGFWDTAPSLYTFTGPLSWYLCSCFFNIRNDQLFEVSRSWIYSWDQSLPSCSPVARYRS